MNKTNIPYLDFCWNPGGFGCSAGCDGCWARKQAVTTSPIRPTCAACRAFQVHWHGERLEKRLSPAGRKKPAVVGVQFLGDLFDAQRPDEQIYAALDLCCAAPQHTYVFLSQQPTRLVGQVTDWMTEQGARTLPANWCFGVTVTDQVQADRRIAALADLPGRLWLSLEPMHGRIDLRVAAIWPLLHGNQPGRVEGLIIGCDNRLSRTLPMAWVRDLVGMADAARVKVYVKQLGLWQCPRCRQHITEEIAGHVACPVCGLPSPWFHAVLVTDPAQFPADLSRRELPWTLTTKSTANTTNTTDTTSTKENT